MKTFSSEHNSEIQLSKKDGEYQLYVNGFVESGKEVEEIWDKAFNKFLTSEKIKNVLVLGFAAGSVVKLLRERFPNCKITGVEIDPVMIEIAKEYFPENLHNTDIKIQDAVDYVNSAPKTLTFDFIIVDCYLNGSDQLKDSKDINFLLDLKKIGKKILINQLLFPKNVDPLKKTEYLKNLNKIHSVHVLRLPYNVMVEY